jgi:16S rRNA (uracil1498-N3)-methyltransferase
MTVHRFFVEEIQTGGLQQIEGPEAHHALKVLRVRENDPIELFDGQGNVAIAKVVAIAKRDFQVAIESRAFEPRDSDGRIHFAVCLPKGDRQRSVVEKLVELGVDSLIPLHSRFTVAEIDRDNRDRLDRYALESCKQCQRNRKLAIKPPEKLANLEPIIREFCELGGGVWILHPGGKDAYQLHREPEGMRLASQQHLFLIGPEGGFGEDEVERCEQFGAVRLGLGSRILRVETAVATAAVLAQTFLFSSHFHSEV